MMIEVEETEDRLVEQIVTFDLASAGGVYRPKARPANRRRQKVLHFVSRDGPLETFTLRQTIPVVGCAGPLPASDAQGDAVEHFFAVQPVSGFQAHMMLCARDYALAVSAGFRFTAPRRMVIAVAVAAHLLADRTVREDVRRWCEARYREPSPGITSGIAHHRPYKLAHIYAGKLIEDMQGAGSEVFG